MKFKHRRRVWLAKIGHWFGRPHEHKFWYKPKGKPRDEPCMICGRTYHECGDDLKKQRRQDNA